MKCVRQIHDDQIFSCCRHAQYESSTKSANSSAILREIVVDIPIASPANHSNKYFLIVLASPAKPFVRPSLPKLLKEAIRVQHEVCKLIRDLAKLRSCTMHRTRREDTEQKNQQVESPVHICVWAKKRERHMFRRTQYAPTAGFCCRAKSDLAITIMESR